MPRIAQPGAVEQPPEPTQDPRNALEQMYAEDLRDIAEAIVAFERRLQTEGPANDDELHAWIKQNMGVDIPRGSVCEGHQAPFTFLSDLYFERTGSALAMANRGGSKTFIVAVLHYLNSTYKPGCEGVTFGATEAQSLRAYSHLKGWVKDEEGNDKEFLFWSKMRETLWRNGSKVEVLPGCLPPHAQLVTPDGNKRISEIVSKKLSGPVKSFNFKTGEFEWCEITGWHNNGKGTDWLKFELDISTLQGPSDLYCTSGHLLLRPDGVKDHAMQFAIGDELCVTARVLSAEQEQIATGMMLGDANISTNNRYRICHAAHQLDYMEWFSDSFSEFGPYWSRRQARNMFDVDLKCARRFTEFRREWYADGTKRIPKQVWDKLEPLGLACWLMDDGTWTRGREGGCWTICAMNFNAHEREQVDTYFDCMGIEGGWRCTNAEKDQWVWRTVGQGGAILQSLVADYIDISQKQPKGYKRWIAGPIQTHSRETAVPARIKAITPTETVQSRYDITVPPYANYVVSSGLVISNTADAVNGPHPQKAHADEVELMKQDTWEESRNMAIGKRLPSGKLIKPQDILTSTRKGPRGRMQMLIDEIIKAREENRRVPYELYIWCIFETAAEQPACQMAPQEEREARLKELGRDPCELCDCDKIQKGYWDKEQRKPRLLSQVCAGRLFRSRGWKPKEDIDNTFMNNSKAVWEAQQECSKPSTENLYMPNFAKEIHAVREFQPDPENGPIFAGIDWGGDNAHSVQWMQLLLEPADCFDWQHQPITLGPRKAGPMLVVFNEIYISGISNEKLAKLVRQQEATYQQQWKFWKVKKRFPDPANPAGRAAFADAGLKTEFKTTRQFDEHIKVIHDWFDDDRIRVDARCEKWIWEAEGWQKDEKGNEVEENNHLMAGFRYALMNIHTNERKAQRQNRSATGAKARGEHRSAANRGNESRSPVAFRQTGPKRDRWRDRLGGPATRPR